MPPARLSSHLSASQPPPHRPPRDSNASTSSSQPPPQSSSQNGLPSSQPPDVSPEELDKLVAEVMRYMLFKNYQQPGVPIKRDELTQLVTKTYKHRGLPMHVIEKAQSRLANTFGYEMREIVRSRQLKNVRPGQNAHSQGGTDIKSYIPKSTVPEDLRLKFVETKENAAASSLALIVVCIIYTSGQKIPEETLWLHLRRFGIKEEDEQHPVFGGIKQSLELLTKQRYIQKEKVSNPEGDSYTYELAERALDNAVLTKIESFVKKMVKVDVSSIEKH